MFDPWLDLTTENREQKPPYNQLGVYGFRIARTLPP
jgi:hypothetical protein